ncbi:MAG: hypothetical protein CSMARM4_0058 [Candidatus Parvarchaeum acidiphilum ARMAN-4_'5-way FS']|jgi:hypothetical protein|uniref:Uncharacterized protein n=1 Tax=Candidatus Parvarchaeum acidiphilum ARMAN-4_'5-way FS' TaxID=994837 RepID=F2UTX8_PARA4|nr:MAG: hypothetical protein CSMARM4_0058 [Candidatus Parvarchaeum acidiphilum ARMAN-4_'5-way FS']
MKKSIEDVITKLDNRLEELKDEKTEKIINYLEISPSAKGQFVEYLTRSYIEDSIKNGSYKALKLGRYGAVPLGVLVGSMVLFMQYRAESFLYWILWQLD